MGHLLIFTVISIQKRHICLEREPGPKGGLVFLNHKNLQSQYLDPCLSQMFHFVWANNTELKLTSPQKMMVCVGRYQQI